MPPKMIVIAGPPGSGKSSIFPVSSFGVTYFNADDRAAEMNGGSYREIPQHIRKAVNLELEAFILGSIERRTSFALETTLRSTVTFEQAKLAKAGVQNRDALHGVERLRDAPGAREGPCGCGGT